MAETNADIETNAKIKTKLSEDFILANLFWLSQFNGRLSFDEKFLFKQILRRQKIKISRQMTAVRRH